MIRAAVEVYKEISKKINKISKEVYRSELGEVIRPTRDWLELQLPILLLSQLFVPTVDRNAEGGAKEITNLLNDENIKGSNLVKSWQKNSLFILAEIEQKWAELWPLEVVFVPFGPFEDLLRRWSGSDSIGG